MRKHLRGSAVGAAAAILLLTAAGTAAADDDTATITGRIWFDRDSDLTQDPDEPGYSSAGAVLFTDEAGGGGYGDTDADGRYTFGNLKPGTYHLGNWNFGIFAPTTEQSATVTVAAGETATVDFGVRGAMIAGTVFADNEGDGQVGPNEKPLDGAQVGMIGPAGLTGAAIADERGGFTFYDLPSGRNYQLIAPDLTEQGLVPMPRVPGQDINPDYRTDRMVMASGEFRQVGIGYAKTPTSTTTTPPPTTTTTPAVLPVANQSSTDTKLANTGTSPIVPTALGVVLLAAGAVALRLARRTQEEPQER